MKLIHIHCHTDIEERVTACRLELHPELLQTYQEMGIITVKDDAITSADLRRLQRIIRLKQNCGVNTSGAAIIVELLEKIEQLQDEIDSLRRK